MLTLKNYLYMIKLQFLNNEFSLLSPVTLEISDHCYNARSYLLLSNLQLYRVLHLGTRYLTLQSATIYVTRSQTHQSADYLSQRGSQLSLGDIGSIFR